MCNNITRFQRGLSLFFRRFNPVTLGHHHSLGEEHYAELQGNRPFELHEGQRLRIIIDESERDSYRLDFDDHPYEFEVTVRHLNQVHEDLYVLEGVPIPRGDYSGQRLSCTVEEIVEQEDSNPETEGV